MNENAYGGAATAQIIPFPTDRLRKSPKSKDKSQRTILHTTPHEPVQPIKDPQDIEAAKRYLLSQQPRWLTKPTNLRNYMMFVININNGCRISDLLSLKIGDVVSPSGVLEDQILIRESKTGKTRYIFLGPSSKDAIACYLNALPQWSRDDYLFSSCKSKAGESKPLGRQQAWKIISDMGKAISEGKDHPLHLGTHSMRKTFGYQRIAKDPENQLLLSQISEMYNHTSLEITYKYLGIDVETKRDLCIGSEL